MSILSKKEFHGRLVDLQMEILKVYPDVEVALRFYRPVGLCDSFNFDSSTVSITARIYRKFKGLPMKAVAASVRVPLQYVDESDGSMDDAYWDHLFRHLTYDLARELRNA